MPNMMSDTIHTSLCLTFTKTQKRTHFKAEETQSQRDSVICKAITWSEYLNLHLVGHITNLIFKCNVILQRDAALNGYFKLFLNFYRNHLGACMGYPRPQITFKRSLQVHLEVYSTLIAPVGMLLQSLFRTSISKQSLPKNGNSSSDSQKQRKHFLLFGSRTKSC